MPHLFVGVCTTAALWLLATYVRRTGLRVSWWQWALTVLGLLYAAFVIEVIIAFLTESEPRAALVMGVLLGVVAVVWGALLNRFVFNRPAQLGGDGHHVQEQ
jgi:hypothetical protein